MKSGSAILILMVVNHAIGHLDDDINEINGADLCGDGSRVQSNRVSCNHGTGTCTVTVDCYNRETHSKSTKSMECLSGVNTFNGIARCTGETCGEKSCASGSWNCERKEDGSCGALPCAPWCDENGGCLPLDDQRGEPRIENPDGSCSPPKCHPFCDGSGGCWPSDEMEMQPGGECDRKKCFPFCDEDEDNGEFFNRIKNDEGCHGNMKRQPDGSCNFDMCYPGFC